MGSAEIIQEAAAALAGGHLEAILHATRGPQYPAGEIATMREYTRAPVILLASGDCSGLLEEALEDSVADLVPLPQLTENIVFAIRKAFHQGRKAHAGDGRRGRVITVFSPKGGVGKTVVSTNLSATLCKMGKSTLCSTSTSSSETPRSCSASSRTRRSTTSWSRRASSTRRSSPATRSSTRAASTCCRRLFSRRTPSS